MEAKVSIDPTAVQPLADLGGGRFQLALGPWPAGTVPVRSSPLLISISVTARDAAGNVVHAPGARASLHSVATC